MSDAEIKELKKRYNALSYENQLWVRFWIGADTFIEYMWRIFVFILLIALAVAFFTSPAIFLYCIGIALANIRFARLDGYSRTPVDLIGFFAQFVAAICFTLVRVYVKRKRTRKIVIISLIGGISAFGLFSTFLENLPALSSVLANLTQMAILLGFPCVLPEKPHHNWYGLYAQFLGACQVLCNGISHEVLSAKRVGAENAQWNFFDDDGLGVSGVSVAACIAMIVLGVLFIYIDEGDQLAKFKLQDNQKTVSWCPQHMFCTLCYALCSALPVNAYEVGSTVPLYYILGYIGAALFAWVVVAIWHDRLEDQYLEVYKGTFLIVFGCSCIVACAASLAAVVSGLAVSQAYLLYSSLYENDLYSTITHAVFLTVQALCAYVSSARDLPVQLYAADYGAMCEDMYSLMLVIASTVSVVMCAQITVEIYLQWFYNKGQHRIFIIGAILSACLFAGSLIALIALCACVRKAQFEPCETYYHPSCPEAQSSENEEYIYYFSKLREFPAKNAKDWTARVKNQSLPGEIGILLAQTIFITSAAFLALFGFAMFWPQKTQQTISETPDSVQQGELIFQPVR